MFGSSYLILEAWLDRSLALDSGEGDDAETIDSFVPSEIWGNNMMWNNPMSDSEKWGYDNYGIGWDLEAGDDATIPDVIWLDPPEVEEEMEQ